MKRHQLEHAIRTACQIIGHPAVIVVGSQAILGSFTEGELPVVVTRSTEIDILPVAADDEEVIRLGDMLEGVAGEASPFHELHGFCIDGVDHRTSVLASGWRDRLVKVQNDNTAAITGNPQFTGWCLDTADLCVAKVCAFREKDRIFVAALLEAGLVDAAQIAERLDAVPEIHRPAADQARAWLEAMQTRGDSVAAPEPASGSRDCGEIKPEPEP